MSEYWEPRNKAMLFCRTGGAEYKNIVTALYALKSNKLESVDRAKHFSGFHVIIAK